MPKMAGNPSTKGQKAVRKTSVCIKFIDEEGSREEENKCKEGTGNAKRETQSCEAGKKGTRGKTC